MKALVIGATGATGKCLVDVLVDDPAYESVVLFVRRKSGISHPKVTEVLTDFDRTGDIAEMIEGDVLFSCLGTTLKAAGSTQQQYYVDYTIPVSFAGIAKRNGVDKIVLLSAYGASAGSRFFYSRVKGKLEDAIADLGFDQYIIFRPGLLLRRNTDRAGERLSAWILHALNRFGIARRFRPLPAGLLAAKLAGSAKLLGSGVHIISLDEIFGFNNQS
jgi:uncharacterized protein YbjT (DUF2867 family)